MTRSLRNTLIRTFIVLALIAIGVSNCQTVPAQTMLTPLRVQGMPVPLIAYEITEHPHTFCGRDRDVCVMREPTRCVIVQHPFAAPADVELARVACLGNPKGKTS